MAYPNYYQPNFYSQPVPDQLAQYRQNYQPPMMAQPVPQNASPMAGSAMVWVPGFQAAQEYLVAPNSAVALWDSNAPVVYLKQADSSGKPSLTVYDLVERTTPRTAQTAPAAPEIDTSAFITREEFARLAERVEALSAKPKRTAKEENNG